MADATANSKSEEFLLVQFLREIVLLKFDLGYIWEYREGFAGNLPL